MALLKRYPRLWLVLPVLFIFVAGVALKLGSQPAPVVSAPLPLGLTSQHVGQNGSRIENVQAGGAGVYSVTASSGDIWGTADSFQYGYQPLNGDGQIVARVLGMEGTTNGWAKAGVMIRETLDPHSRQAMLVGTVSNGLAFQWRAEPGGASGSTGGSLGTAPCWVKLIRYGNFVMGYESKDGVNWQLVDWQMVEMSQQVYAGVVVSSHDETSASTARFDHVQVSAVNAWEAAPVLGEGDGLRGDYFRNRDLAGAPLMVRKDRTVNFDWDIGAPMELTKPGPFSVRWTGEIQAQFTEPYTLYLETDEGVRVWLNGKLVMNDWVDRYDGKSQATVNLVAGQKYPLQIEYYKNQGLAHARMLWSSPSTPKRPVPQSQLYAAASMPAAAADLIEEPEEDPMVPWAVAPSSQLSGVWNHCDIGPSAGGGAEVSNRVFTVTGYGSDIWNKADGLHYVYQPLTGDGQVVARVLGMAGANPWAKAGLMIRETLDAGSKHATLACTLANGLGYVWRVGGSNDTFYSAANRLDTPCWLKLVREGDLLGGFISTNGVDWQLADWERVKMGQNVYVGLAVSSHDDQKLCTAWFDQVRVSSVDAPNPLPVIGTGDGLKGDYFANTNLSGAPVLSQVDSVVLFDWDEHAPTGLPSPDFFSIRWTGEIQAKFTEPCTFYLYTDDGVRVWLNEKLIIDNWVDQYEGESTATVNLTAGQRYLLRIEYYQNRSQAHARLMWSSPSLSKQIVPQSQLYSQPTLDPDGSGLPVIWEMIYFGHTGVNPNADPDRDGLSNLQEYQNFTNPTNSDTSGSGIPDGWLVAHGLNPLDPNVGAEDPDQDGLSNLQEYLAGTDPNNPCSKIAGVPDSVAVLYLGTNCATTVATVVATANGAQATNFLGHWQADGTAIYALDRRGGLDFVLSVSKADKYMFNFIGTQNQTNPLETSFKLQLGIDGQTLGHYILNVVTTTNGELALALPYLKAGSHTVHVFWDGVASDSSLRIKRVKLLAVSGTATNQNGLKDWVNNMVRAESGLDTTNATISSHTSPICLEGRDPYPTLLLLTNNLTNALSPVATTDKRWYVNVPLLANTQTVFQASYQNGALTGTRKLQWLPVNLLTATNNLTIRKGDSLLFNALPTNGVNGSLQIGIGTNSYTGKTANGISCKFTTPGICTVTGTYTPASGSPQSGSVTVDVVQQNLPNVEPAAWTGMQRNLNLNLAPEVVLQADSRLTCFIAGTNADGTVRLTLGADENEVRSIIARLGTNGPVLDSTQVQGFDEWSGDQTYTTIVQVYPDGSQLVQMLMISSPVETNVTFVLEPIVSGVMFDDGTTIKTLTATNFDALDQCPVRFIRPASAQTSVCHSIKAYQGNYQLGYRP